jgi:hypothetical protein
MARLNKLRKNDDCGLRKEDPGLKPNSYSALFRRAKALRLIPKSKTPTFPQPAKSRPFKTTASSAFFQAKNFVFFYFQA